MDPFLLKLLALNTEFNFKNPPPPELKYKYPKANAAIIKRIGNCLLENIPFYTQVLHLMNRMNLPPPFKSLHLTSSLTRETACQTDPVQWIRKPDLGTDESELESEEEDPPNRKRKRPENMSRSIRLKAILETEKGLRKIVEEKTDKIIKRSSTSQMIFEKNKVIKSEIRISVPQALPMEQQTLEETTKPRREDDRTEPEIITQETLLTNKIPLEQLKETSIFQKYDPGTPSNVLYIKNLAKTVTVEDLQQIYNQYGRSPENISVDLKTTGRLRGQAFITFSNPYEDAEDPEFPIGQRLIDKALQDTNGFILKNKPMYVCYSKSSARKSQ